MRLFWIVGIFMCFTAMCCGQDIMAVHIEGQVRICNQGENESHSRALSFGPVSSNQKLILSKNSKVRFIKQSGEQCEVTQAGIYNIGALNFLRTSESSFLNKLGGFIKSFLEAKHSSESKDSYKNTVHAISRGDATLAILNFPFSGVVPSETSALPFKWTHFCDTCTYEFDLYALDTRSKIYSTSTRNKEYSLDNYLERLQPGNEYYWTVRVAGTTADVNASTFRLSEPGAYQVLIDELEQQIIHSQTELQDLPRTVFIMKSLEELGFVNYAMFYGWQKCSKNPENVQLTDYVQSYYESLLKLQLESQY
ncbi:MAG: hypothetical protein IPM34_13560 [Saprospiraceae bacterium]|nr:hypothetical protein [Saprospiraceae bacterium]